MKKLYLLTLLLFPSIFSLSQNYKIQAILTYNLTKYLTWEENTDTTFKIGVFGNIEFLNELKIISKNYQVYEKSIEILEFKTVNQITDCRMLCVTREMNEELVNIIKHIENQQTLLISDDAKKGIEGQNINFVIQDSKQHFEIYPSNILKKKIKIASELLEIAIIVKN